MPIELTQILDYQVRKPLVEIEDPKILFLLHGYGSHEQDLFSFADYLPETLLIISLRAPLSLSFGGYAWYSIYFNAAQDKWSDDEEAKSSQKLILNNIEYHKKQFNSSHAKVSLLGFSQGAILSWAVGLSHPDKIEHIIGLSGYINESIFTYSDSNLEHVKCFMSHGKEDLTIPIQWARNSANTSKRKGVQVSLLEYEAGHGINSENFSDLITWLKK